MPTNGEQEVWESIWKLPQAIMWDGQVFVRTVARYVLTLTYAEQVGGHLDDLKYAAEARQIEDRLGLSPLSMLRLRWAIIDDEEDKDAPVPAGITDIRKRLRERGNP